MQLELTLSYLFAFRRDWGWPCLTGCFVPHLGHHPLLRCGTTGAGQHPVHIRNHAPHRSAKNLLLLCSQTEAARNDMFLRGHDHGVFPMDLHRHAGRDVWIPEPVWVSTDNTRAQVRPTDAVSYASRQRFLSRHPQLPAATTLHWTSLERSRRTRSLGQAGRSSFVGCLALQISRNVN